MPITIDPSRVAQRQATLDHARAQLKASFIGIDGVIDELLDAVAVWYVMPEVVSRPVIISLWGMTGVGKTDLVRRLVAALDLQQRFVEVELTNSDSTTIHTSVASRLAESGVMDGEPSVVLFDEIQRFNTLDNEGDPVPNTKFADFWELLSDGRLARRERDDFDYIVASTMASIRERERRLDRGEDPGDDRIGIWQAQRLRDVFGVAGDLGDLAAMSLGESLACMSAALSSKTVYEPIDCRKCLVIISGNLDEAFTMAHQSAEADVDADIFHAFTSKITLVDIKVALNRRFKPEQVARFGNIHLIYASLTRASFEELIRREVDRVAGAVHEAFGIGLRVDTSVHALIYRNGVFPVQGVRPVFSSVADVLESNLAKILFDAVLVGDDDIALHYDGFERAIVAHLAPSGRTRRVSYSGRVDRIRGESAADQVANVAAHEAGHAVAYGVLFGLAPLQLTARVASSTVGGFTFPHHIYRTRGSLLDSAKVLLAGGIAEELLFGAEQQSVGHTHDRQVVTQQVIDYVRRYGFDGRFQADYMLDNAYGLDRRVTEPVIEAIVARLVVETTELLADHRAALTSLAVRLAGHAAMTATEVAEVLGAHGIDLEVQPEGFEWMPPYSDLLVSET